MPRIDRRTLIGAGALALTPAVARAATPASAIPIIDTHIHLFDPNRPQGAPYRGPAGSSSNTLGAFPDRYMKLVGPLGSVGAIVVEASAWIEDNFWVLEQCAKHSSMLGLIGNLQPDAADFATYVDRLGKNPLFLGIRYGNLWGYDLVAKSRDPKFLEGARLLAERGLTLDTANPTVGLLQAVSRLNDAVPNLRIVIDHLPKLDPTPAELRAYEAALQDLRGRPNVYTKISSVIRPVAGVVSTRLEDHRALIDHLYEVFGEDRVVFGSDWPNSDGASPVNKVVEIMRAYFATKTRAQGEKYFWRNSIKAYQWKARSPAQAALRA